MILYEPIDAPTVFNLLPFNVYFIERFYGFRTLLIITGKGDRSEIKNFRTFLKTESLYLSRALSFFICDISQLSFNVGVIYCAIKSLQRFNT